MTREEFHKLFRSVGPVVLPVIHVRDAAQTIANARIAISEGAAGVFLINHDFDEKELLPIVERLVERYPALWLGLSFFRVGGSAAFPVLGRLMRKGTTVDAYWADNAHIDERLPASEQHEARSIAADRLSSGWSGLYFGGTAFKGQRLVAPEHYETAARLAASHMDVVCTSGTGTGKEPDIGKIAAFRRGAGERPVAVASGITPENAHTFATDVDCLMVATGISYDGDFYNIEPARLARLLRIAREHGAEA